MATKKTTKKVEKKETFKGWAEVKRGDVTKYVCPGCGAELKEEQIRNNYEPSCPICGTKAE